MSASPKRSTQVGVCALTTPMRNGGESSFSRADDGSSRYARGTVSEHGRRPSRRLLQGHRVLSSSAGPANDAFSIPTYVSVTDRIRLVAPVVPTRRHPGPQRDRASSRLFRTRTRWQRRRLPADWRIRSPHDGSRIVGQERRNQLVDPRRRWLRSPRFPTLTKSPAHVASRVRHRSESTRAPVRSKRRSASLYGRISNP